MKVIKVGSTKITGHKVPEQKVPTTTAGKLRLADKMRENPTDSELIVCREMERRGYRFKFQHVIHGYIADFYFPNRNYILELDGKWHREVADSVRDDHLRRKGIKTLRIKSQDVFRSLRWVMSVIEKTCCPVVNKPKKNRKGKGRVKRVPRVHVLDAEFAFVTAGI